MAGTISLENADYGPIVFDARQGGNFRYRFDIRFSGAAPPSQFTYTIRMKTPAGTTVKTVSATVATNGQATVPVKVFTPLTQDAGGPIPVGPYRNEWEVTAAGYTKLVETFCMGPRSCGCPTDDCPE